MTAAVAALATPVAAEGMDAWIAKGWTVLFEATGDLDRDGRDDLAAILEAPDGETAPQNTCDGMDDYSDTPARRLVIELNDGAGGRAVSADEPRAVLRRDQGGVFGDPLDSLSIERSAVVISHYGGSRWRWGDTLRFRLDGGQWRLIGMTEFWLDSLSANNVEYDYNPLTGRMARTVEINEAIEGEPVCVACRIGEACPERDGCFTETKPAQAGRIWFDVGAKPPIPLEGFSCWREETGLLRYLGFRDGR